MDTTIYVHFPWCIKKCPYCDFHSIASKGKIPENDYLKALLHDLDQDISEHPYLLDRKIKSIFIGGGTPSLISPAIISKLLDHIESKFKLEKEIEITIEANPSSIEIKNFALYKAMGINRISIGIQSFDPESLRFLDRPYKKKAAFEALDVAQNIDFQYINADIIYGLPIQKVKTCERDIDQLLNFNINHLSYYELSIEKNTLFYKNKVTTMDDEEKNIAIKINKEKLNNYGFYQYEISAFAKKDAECVHNRNYWKFGDYIGIGSGASSKITSIFDKQNPENKIIRYSKTKNITKYLSCESQSNKIYLNDDNVIFQFMLNACRLYEPIDFDLFESRTFINRSTIKPKLKKASELGLIKCSKSSFVLTEFGKLFYNDLVSIFL